MTVSTATTPQLAISVSVRFARYVFYVDPPVPTHPSKVPPIQTKMGKLFVHFSDWDVRHNQPGDPPDSFDSLMLHFVADNPPDAVLNALSRESPLRVKVVSHRNDPELLDLFQRAQYAELSRDEKQHAQHKYSERREKVARDSAVAAEEFLALPVVGPYVKNFVGDLELTTARLMETLRLDFGQHLIPDRPTLFWQNAVWHFPDGSDESMSDELEVQLFSKLFWDTWSEPRPAFSFSRWPEVVAAVQEPRKRRLSEILLANAEAACDLELGHPRVALIEAVTALEVEIRRLMQAALGAYGLSKSAIEAVVKETPLADLVNVWARRECPTVRPADLEICAIAVHERNELIHLERRNITRARASEFVAAIRNVISQLPAIPPRAPGHKESVVP